MAHPIARPSGSDIQLVGLAQHAIRAGVRGGVPVQRRATAWETHPFAAADRGQDLGSVLLDDQDPAQFFSGLVHAAWMSMVVVGLVVSLLAALGLLG